MDNLISWLGFENQGIQHKTALYIEKTVLTTYKMCLHNQQTDSSQISNVCSNLLADQRFQNKHNQYR